MLQIHHLNCGSMHAPPAPPAVCHCLLLRTKSKLVLVDTGLGTLDVELGASRLGRDVIDAAGMKLNRAETAISQVKALGADPAGVTDIILTHADPDHAGGISDFPTARVHVSAEEHAAVQRKDPRYVPEQFLPAPRWILHPPSTLDWFGLEARPIPIDPALEIFLVPLFGHTAGHCGVAIKHGRKWLLHAGDAYYLRAELASDDAPSAALAAARAHDDTARLKSLNALRRLLDREASAIEVFGYHDPAEMP